VGKNAGAQVGTPDRIASFLLKPFARACKEFDLLAEGDRIAVAVSGGKDSRALLDLLLRYRERASLSYEVTALHVVGSHAGLPDLTSTLRPWFEESGVAYRFVPLVLPPDEPLPLSCFRCSWNRRKALFLAADDLRCNKLALGHHADDAAVTTLLNLLFAGRLETLEPKVSFFEGHVTVIRPLIYVKAKELARYARATGFPPAPPCPAESDSNRRQVEGFLRGFGRRQAHIRANLWRVARGKAERNEGDDERA
jgi:tRNA 2-thiocytidine biosynthesis protein TtcA